MNNLNRQSMKIAYDEVRCVGKEQARYLASTSDEERMEVLKLCAKKQLNINLSDDEAKILVVAFEEDVDLEDAEAAIVLHEKFEDILEMGLHMDETLGIVWACSVKRDASEEDKLFEAIEGVNEVLSHFNKTINDETARKLIAEVDAYKQM